MGSMLLFENRNTAPAAVAIDSYFDMIEKKDMFLFGRSLTTVERSHSTTSPWMNRICLETKDSRYFIIPKNVHHGHDIEIATDKRFAVILFKGPEISNDTEVHEPVYADISAEDITEFYKVLEDMLTPKAKERYKAQASREDYCGMFFQYYRTIYAPEPDKNNKKLRDALENDINQCRAWAERIDKMKETAESHADKEEDALFNMFLIRTDARAIAIGTTECKAVGVDLDDGIIPEEVVSLVLEPFRLKGALRDPKLTEMLIKALEPESIQIIREMPSILSKLLFL